MAYKPPMRSMMLMEYATPAGRLAAAMMIDARMTAEDESADADPVEREIARHWLQRCSQKDLDVLCGNDQLVEDVHEELMKRCPKPVTTLEEIVGQIMIHPEQIEMEAVYA